MNAEMTVRTIQVILAPVVMVTACAMLLNGIIGQYSSISSRLQSIAHERYDLLRNMADMSDLKRLRLQQIDIQLPQLLRHHKVIHDAILIIYWAISLFILSMFAIALATATNLTWMATLALFIFLGGTATLLVSMGILTLDFRTSHCALRYEVQQICGLGKK